MKIHWIAFNYLIVAALLFGCKSPEEKRERAESRRQRKELSTIRFHLEASGNSTGRASLVPILRSAPVSLNVITESFLDERDVLRATITDYQGSFVIQIQFDDHGTFVLDNISAANKGKRIAIMSSFGEERWIAAPVITRRISEGTLSFTPDASREEAVRIVRGLNNAAAKLRDKSLIRGVW